MKDNNKKIIIAIIAVATIIVAIIGATFAFFSASGGSANNAVTANATTLANLGFTSSYSKIATNLVPVASESPYFERYPGIAASGSHSCLDDVGNEICSIYEFTITNTASVAQTIYVSFVPSENTFDNMYFAAFNTTIASANYVVATGSNGSRNNFSLIPQTTSGNSTLGHQATKLTKNSTNPIDMPGLSTSLNGGESITYTVLVWLQETKNEQNTEQGGMFKAGINVTTGGNSTGVTGVMGESNNSNYVYTINTTPVYVGSAIPNETDVYSTSTSAMANFDGKTFYFKHKIVNDIVEESYIEFQVTPEMASANAGMTPGTYTLKVGDEGATYTNNKNALITAFGASNCNENIQDGSVTCQMPSSFRAWTSNIGTSTVAYGTWGCGYWYDTNSLSCDNDS